jgi:hypothetical protein
MQEEFEMGKQWRTTTAREGGIPTTVLEEISRSEIEQEIAALAHKLWEDRGCPEGTPEEDWFRAEHEITKSKVLKQGAS